MRGIAGDPLAIFHQALQRWQRRHGRTSLSILRRFKPSVPVPSTSQLPSQSKPHLTITKQTATPTKETQNKIAPSIQSSTSMTQPMQPLKTSQEKLKK
ncbi:hypothetical protein LAZ67_18001718 [Cordylochernes scorpioides]|uniref:Uncharacterized protein n=1 Tax=Cordylochernes scorpioides TaxID=51811 RepID=A0ABY6LG47_9ARAC|nr:hypothetical protein LAZ67_18001718 [Cordylochernes scorpioides]